MRDKTNKLIVANLKVNFSLEEAMDYKSKINEKFDNLVICPSYLYIKEMISDHYEIGSQDGFYIDKGAYTGEVSFHQLQNIGVKYSIIGHSERRHKFLETNEIVKLKYDSCLNHKIIPILCVGETKEERDSKNVFEVIKSQIESVFSDKTIEDVIIAYEPVWAIGTNVTPTLNEIEEVHIYIRSLLKDLGIDSRVLYGGSVNLNNIEEFSKSYHIDGFLIGSASLDPDDLMKMIKLVM